MLNDVIDKGHVLHHRPWRSTALIARRKKNGHPVLRLRPIVLKNVAVHQYALGVFQFKKILHNPVPSGITRVIRFPSERLETMVVAKFDVGLNQVLNRWISPAQHEVLARSFQIVIDDLEWPGAIPSSDRLRIGADLVDG